VTTSPHLHERVALASLRERLPDREPFRPWANFTFIPDGGTRNRSAHQPPAGPPRPSPRRGRGGGEEGAGPRSARAAESRGLTGLLAGLADLVPWVQQWHNDLDPAFAQRLGDFFASFTDSEARSLGLTMDDLQTWTP
jgi:hypothetical protein